MFRDSTFALFVFVFGVPGLALADLTPRQIIDKSMKQQVFRAKGVQMQLAMLLKNKAGEKRQRALSARSVRKDGLSRTLVKVQSPPDVRGMGFLFMQRKGRADDQFMYMPALKIAKRIIGSNKRASFLGSQFTYADLEWSALERGRYKRLKDEKVGGADCYVLDGKPQAKDESGYSRIQMWVRRSDFAMLRVKFYDTRNQLKKVLFVKEFQTISGNRFATKLKMKNVQNGETTLLAISNIKMRDDLSADTFTVRALRKQ
jgi:outer membrane lipoprotein-sorting protein